MAFGPIGFNDGQDKGHRKDRQRVSRSAFHKRCAPVSAQLALIPLQPFRPSLYYVSPWRSQPRYIRGVPVHSFRGLSSRPAVREISWSIDSVRLMTGVNASVVSRHDYLPLGEEVMAGTAARATSLGFGVADALTPEIHRQRTGLRIRAGLLRSQVLRKLNGPVHVPRSSVH
jgi:hypothetical protein